MWGEILHTLRLLPHFPLNKWLAAKKLEDSMISRKNEFGKVGSLSEPPHVLSLNPSQAVHHQQIKPIQMSRLAVASKTCRYGIFITHMVILSRCSWKDVLKH